MVLGAGSVTMVMPPCSVVSVWTRKAGAWPGSSVGGGVNTTLGPYKLSNVLIDGYDVVVNRPRKGTAMKCS